jgi:hypothetical protein
MKKLACLILLAACATACKGGARSKVELEARRALSGSFVLDVDRTAAALPAEKRKFFLKANETSAAKYTISEDGSWTMTVPLGKGQVVREGTWAFKAGRYQFTPTKMDGAVVPGAPFEVKVDGDGLLWIEDETSYLKKA